MGYDCQCICNYIHRLRSEPYSWDRAAIAGGHEGVNLEIETQQLGERGQFRNGVMQRLHQLMVDEGVISRTLHVGGPRAMS